MRKFIALAALVAGLSFARATAQAADSCCSGGTCYVNCTKCGLTCIP